MKASSSIFIVGTKDRPTMFLMWSGELSDCVDDAMLHMSRKEAENEIKKCDNPEALRVYEGELVFEDL